MRLQRLLPVHAVAVIVAVAVLSGCSAYTGAERTAGPRSASSQAPGADRLTIRIEQQPGQLRTYTLSCDPPAGTHPTPDLACDVLGHVRDPFETSVPGTAETCEKLPSEERAVITGTWHGQPVTGKYDRADTCHAQRWGELSAVLVTMQSTDGLDPG